MLGDSERYVKLFLDSTWASGHSTIIEKGSKYVNVPMIRLDTIVKKLKLRRIDLVKIDVEGGTHGFTGSYRNP